MKNNLVDLHSHIVYGVDDGARTIEEALAMVQAAYDQGVRYLLATPHYHRHLFHYSRALIEERFVKLCRAVKKHLPDMNLYLGCEVFCTYGMEMHLQKPEFLTIHDTNKVLLEFHPTVSFAEISRHVHDFQLFGYEVILAHVERYACLDRERLQALAERHCLLQINAGNLLPPKLLVDPKRAVKKRARAYVKEGLVHLVASDMHDLDRRAPFLAQAYDEVLRLGSEEQAQRLFVDQPMEVLGLAENHISNVGESIVQ